MLPLFVGVCAMFASALVLTAAKGTDVRTDDVLPLVVAGVFAGLTVVVGPGWGRPAPRQPQHRARAHAR